MKKLKHAKLPDFDSYRISSQNGSFRYDEQLPEGVIFNNNVKVKGFSLFVSSGVKLSKPIHIACLFDKPGVDLRNSIIMEAGSSAEVLISYCANSASSVKWDMSEVNDATNITLGNSANLNMVRLQKINNAVRLTTDTTVRQDAYSCMKTCYVIMYTETVCNRMEVKLTGVEAEHTVSGLSLTQQSEHAENDIRIVHASPDCKSNQLFKHILSDTSTGVFTGRIVVDKDAQKTAAFQRSANILLNPKAKMNIRPQLEIYADDVKCSHGATVGQLDAEALFYLRSRGIGENEAKKMLLNAFAGEVIDDISCKPFRKNILRMIDW